MIAPWEGDFSPSSASLRRFEMTSPYGRRRARSENCGRSLLIARPFPAECGRAALDGRAALERPEPGRDVGRELVYVFGRCGRGACAGRDGRQDFSGSAVLYAFASNPSATLRGTPREMKRSRSRRFARSSGVTKLMASPIALARPV